MRPHRTQNEPAELTSKKSPIRQCAVTRERLPQAQLLRFACGPDRIVVPDVRAKLPGRGVWIQPRREYLNDAIKRGVFQRAFEGNVDGLNELPDLTEARLLDACQNRLGMAKRAGEVILGFDQVRAELRKRRPGLLIEAADGSEDGRNKVFALAKAAYDEFQVAGALNSEELGVAFGRTGVIHALLKRGPFALNMQLDYARLTGFRAAPEETWFSVNTRSDAAPRAGGGQELI